MVSDFGSSLPEDHAACRSNAGVVWETVVKYHGLDALNHAAQAAPEAYCHGNASLQTAAVIKMLP